MHIRYLELVVRLVDALRNPLTPRADLLRIVAELETQPLYRDATKTLDDAVASVVRDIATIGPLGDLRCEGRSLHLADVAKRLGVDADASDLSRLGLAMTRIGYQAFRPQNRGQTRYRAPFVSGAFRMVG